MMETASRKKHDFSCQQTTGRQADGRRQSWQVVIYKAVLIHVFQVVEGIGIG